MADTHNVPESYLQFVQANLANVLDTTDLAISGAQKRSGKVRDCYDLKDKILLVTSDRVSAFDRILASIPFKGQVLTQVSVWWFEKTKHIVPNHLLSVPDPNAIVGKKCTVFPIEFVVRGFMTGTTSTSIWTNYSKGVRQYCGHNLPDGIQKNQRLPKIIVTPTTKEEEHDRLITPEEIVKEGWMKEEDWVACEKIAAELFEFGQKTALEHGLILVDTKYEFGKDSEGNIILVDEIHTPDSSRYWIAGSYEERFKEGKAPENIDKDILRNWYNQHCDPYKDAVLPKAPAALVCTLSLRYIELYERITGLKFQFPNSNNTIADRLQSNIDAYTTTTL